MCAACVAQGIGYVGASVGALRLMAVRASRRTKAGRHDLAPAPPDSESPLTEPEPLVGAVRQS
jgi:hypothetical protein